MRSLVESPLCFVDWSLFAFYCPSYMNHRSLTLDILISLTTICFPFSLHLTSNALPNDPSPIFFILLYFSIFNLFTLTMGNLPLHTAYCNKLLINYYHNIINRSSINFATHMISIKLQLLLRYWSLKFNFHKTVIAILACQRGEFHLTSEWILA